MNPNSMLHWWPLVKDLDIPMPKTVILEEPREGLLTEFCFAVLDSAHGKDLDYQAILPEWQPYEERIYEEADKLGFPLFWRTDILSAKHSWKRTCYLPERDAIKHNLVSLLEEHLAGFGIPRAHALVLREFLELDSSFTAFPDLPISAERRYFVRDGAVVCAHPYWPEEAIHSPSEEDWKQRLARLNRQSAAEIDLLTRHATLLAERLDGFWSVDFARGTDGTWYFIDAARGEDSWHPEDCEHAPKRPG